VAGDAAFKAGGVLLNRECVNFECSYKIDFPFKDLNYHLKRKLTSLAFQH